MREDEVYKLLSKIRIYYQNMSKSDDVNDEWYKVLKNYDAEDVLDGLDRYLKDEKNRTRIPMPHDLTQGLLTIEQKAKRIQQNSGYVVRCNLCQKEMSLDRYNTHYGRCLSTMYLISVLKKQGKQVEYELLASLSQEKFNEVYEKYKDYDNAKKLNTENIFKKGERYDYS